MPGSGAAEPPCCDPRVMRRPRLVLAVAALVVVTVAVADRAALRDASPPAVRSAARAVEFGLSGEQPAALSDPRYRALGLTNARVQASWDLVLPAHADAALYRGLADERTRLVAWFTAARAAGVRDVLLAVKASRDLPDDRPDTATYADGIGRLLAWLDGQGFGNLIGAVSAWNEPDLGDASAAGAELAGGYFERVRRRCAALGCTPVAGEFSDRDFTPAYFEAYLRGAGGTPRVWAWHAYEDAWTRDRDPSLPRLRMLLRLVGPKAEIWLTEQGGIVRRGRADDGKVEQDPARASADLAFLLAHAARADPRITRFYAYQWQGEAPPRWDSGLIAPDGTARPAYCTFAVAVGAKIGECGAAP